MRHNILVLEKEGYDVQPILNHIQFCQVIGPCADDIAIRNFLGRLPNGYRWTPDPQITLDLVRKLPKSDLHCTLVGSVAAEVIFDCLKKGAVTTSSVIGHEIDSCDDFVKEWKSFELSTKKTLTQSALRNPENLRTAVFSVLKSSFDDGVVYLEVSLSLIGSLHSPHAISLSLSLSPFFQ